MQLPRLKDVTAVVGLIGVIFGVIKWVVGDDTNPTAILYYIGNVAWGIYAVVLVYLVGAAGVSAVLAKVQASERAQRTGGIFGGAAALLLFFLFVVNDARYLLVGDYDHAGWYDRTLNTLTGLVALAIPTYLYYRASEESEAKTQRD
jgi:hypothetical protein